MAIASELETPTQPVTSQSNFGSQKTFQVPTQPVDGKGEVVAFIGPGVEFKGEIFYEGSVQIDGTMDGQIHTSGTLLVGEQAVINAKVNVGSVISKGKVNGDIVAGKQVQLLSTAVMDGSLKTPELSMEIGVVFNGDITMRTEGDSINGQGSQKHKEPMSYQKPNGNSSTTSNTMVKKNKVEESTKDSSGTSGADSNTEKKASDASSTKPDSSSPSK